MAMRAVRPLLRGYPMGMDLSKPPGEGHRHRRPPTYRNIMEIRPHAEQGMPLVYPRWYEDSEEKIDHNYILFNRPQKHSEKIGLVVETTKKTVIVACRYFVRYRNFARVVARTQRCWAHDEDNACVVGDVVQIRRGIRRGKFKTFILHSILEPNIDGRERLKKGLAAMDPPKKPQNTSGYTPIFDLKRGGAATEEEAQRANQLAGDIKALGADYDGSLASQQGKDKWAYLDDGYGEAEEDEDEDGDDGEFSGEEPEGEEDEQGAGGR
eukprot:TRINITY_DN61605_c0_g1_i1.p1 TRINITY_DN61605_c0_g1~~TRINITY_DN61605_c0_g1_i1.p1  ORF type:complete len:295 (+),score=110.88 TRINITY_DN61605_c0_g1_i1:85-885(+)